MQISETVSERLDLEQEMLTLEESLQENIFWLVSTIECVLALRTCTYTVIVQTLYMQ